MFHVDAVVACRRRAARGAPPSPRRPDRCPPARGAWCHDGSQRCSPAMLCRPAAPSATLP